jgi:hypothetical protein
MMMLQDENFPLIELGELRILVCTTTYRRRILIDPRYFIHKLPEEEEKLESSKNWTSFLGRTRQ